MCSLDNLTPKQVVNELDRYIIGQSEAKRSVAVAIRNRWRRQLLDPEMAREVYPKNIIMIGPTGVGKTEIARRLAKITGAPFIKVEASKFTEVGYHGRDVESMVRDLLEQAVSIVRAEQAELVHEKACKSATDQLVNLLLPTPTSVTDVSGMYPEPDPSTAGVAMQTSVRVEESTSTAAQEETAQRLEHTRKRLREQLEAGKLDDREVELVIQQKLQAQVMFANMGIEQMDPDMANMFERLIPEQTKRRKVSVAEARQILIEEETDKLLDRDKITSEAIMRTEESGMIFLDEMDKIASPTGEGGQGGGSPDISRQGVQRDLLPIVEGSAVSTRYGIVNTDHILFIAAGAFHAASVSDLMPELQGRFPIRVELTPLSKEDFVRILTEPSNALTRQQQALLKVEGLDIHFDKSSIDAMADLASKANANMENIGARRLMTIIEKVFEQINFDAPEMVESGQSRLTIDDKFVCQQVESIVNDKDLSKFVL